MVGEGGDDGGEGEERVRRRGDVDVDAHLEIQDAQLKAGTEVLLASAALMRPETAVKGCFFGGAYDATLVCGGTSLPHGGAI